MEVERPRNLLTAESVALSLVVAIVYEVVKWVLCVMLPTEPWPVSLVFDGDDDVDVPATLRAVRRDFVYRSIVFVRHWQ